MRTIVLILLIAVLALGTDAVLFNGSYTQGIWRTISQYSLELRGPNDPVPPASETRPAPG